MQKVTKKLNLVMAALMIVFSALSYVPAKAATVVPKVQFVGEQKLEYAVGERITFNLNAENYGGRVQYRVVLWDDNTKSMKDLWDTADKYYTNWMPYGNETLPLGWVINEPGSYRITIYTKRAGLANNKTAQPGANCDSYLEGPAFLIKPAITTPVEVTSIAPVSDVTVNEEGTPVLPTEVTLNLADNTTKTAKVTWAAVDTTKVGIFVVEGIVEGTKLKAKARVIVKEVKLKVLSVEAINNKQLEVVFNSPVDNETATDEDNYALESANKALTVVGADFGLSADAKTLVITLPVAADQQDLAELTIDGVEGLDETTIDDIEFLDTTLPKALSAEIVGNDTVKITFSEPINTSPKDLEDYFEVNDGDYYIASVSKMNNDREANITLHSDIDEVKIKVAVGAGIEDYAGFNVLKTTLSTKVVIDEEAPVVVDYKNATQSGITLIFNEDIEIKDEDQENFYHTNTKSYIDADLTDAAVNGKELTLKFTEQPLPEGTVYVYVAAKSVNDLWDNTNSKQVVKVQVKSDEIEPELKTLKVNTEDKITLVFTEEIDSVDEDNFIILDKDGDEVEDIIDDITLEEDTVVIEFSENLRGNYKLVIEDLEDLVGNKIDDTTKSFTVEDMTVPIYTDFSATIYNAGKRGQMIKVNFDQEMAKEGKYSVLDAERYIIGGENLEDLVYDIKLVDDGTAVEIEILSLKDDDDKGVDFDDDDSIVIARVADAAGNYTAKLSGTIEIDASGIVGIDSVKATDIDTVVVTFGDYFTDFDAKDIELFYGSETELTIDRMKTSVNDDNKTVVTFTIEEKLGFDGSYKNKTVYAKVVATESVNKYDETLKLDDYKKAEDGISPEVATVEVNGDDVDNVVAAAGKILITMTEDINENSLSSRTFLVENYTVVSVVLGAAENIVVLNVTPNGTRPATPVVETTVTQKVPFEDAEGNEVSGLSLEVYKVLK